MNQDTRAINKLNCPNAEWFTSARDGVDKHHDPNVLCTQPDGTGRHVAPACVCSVFLASTSRTTVFLQKRRRHVRHSQINRPLLERPFTASFIWLLLYEPITPGHQHPLHCCGGSFNLQTSLRLLFLTRNKMSSIIWCPKSISPSSITCMDSQWLHLQCQVVSSSRDEILASHQNNKHMLLPMKSE